MINRKAFFDGIRHGPFPGKLTKPQVEGISLILDEAERRALRYDVKVAPPFDIRWLAYILASVKWETDHTMQPVKEMGSKAYLESKAYFPWYGRGYIQLTWKKNYEKFRERVKTRWSGIDIIANPDDAMIPDVAVFILFEGMINGEFTGKKLSDYFNNTVTNAFQARRIVNGVDRASEIANIYKMFYADLSAAQEN